MNFAGAAKTHEANPEDLVAQKTFEKQAAPLIANSSVTLCAGQPRIDQSLSLVESLARGDVLTREDVLALTDLVSFLQSRGRKYNLKMSPNTTLADRIGGNAGRVVITSPGNDPGAKRLQQQSHPSIWGEFRHGARGAQAYKN